MPITCCHSKDTEVALQWCILPERSRRERFKDFCHSVLLSWDKCSYTLSNIKLHDIWYSYTFDRKKLGIIWWKRIILLLCFGMWRGKRLRLQYLSVVQCLPGQTSCTDGGMCQVPVITAYFGEWGEGERNSFFVLLSLFSGQVRSACGILARKTGLKKNS